MKLSFATLQNGNLQHTEIELPKGYLDLSIELETGSIFQVNVEDDEQALSIREVTYRKLAIMPSSSNAVQLKGI